MSDSPASVIIGYVLFGVSEILGLMDTSSNGIIHTIVLGLKNSFSSPSKASAVVNDVEKVVEPVIEKVIGHSSPVAPQSELLERINSNANKNLITEIIDSLSKTQDATVLENINELLKIPA